MKGLCQNTNPRNRLLEEIAMNVTSVVSLHLQFWFILIPRFRSVRITRLCLFIPTVNFSTLFVYILKTSGIPGGYRLVSTYDLPHFPKLGRGVFRSKLWSSQIWSFPKWGGYSGVNFGHLKSEVFRNGGVFWSKLWSSQIWSFLKWGGVLWSNFGHLKSEMGGGGGLSGLKFQKGAFWKIWTKIYCSARNLLVHHR